MFSDTTGDMVITNTQIMEAAEKGANDRALHIAENLLWFRVAQSRDPAGSPNCR